MPDLDPSTPGFIEDPHPTYRRLRADDPVHWSPKLRAWILTRHADAETFFHHAGLTADRSMASRSQGSRRPSTTRSLMTDGPGYASLRTLAIRFLTTREVARLRPRVEALVDELLDQADQRGRLELIGDFAFPLPVAVIAELLGVPEHRRADLREISAGFASSQDHYFSSRAPRTAPRPTVSLSGLLRDLVAERTASPRDDLVTKLLEVEHNGDRLSAAEVVNLCTGLLFAGHETTVNLIGNGLLALLSHPDELRRLRSGEVDVRAAVEELLRYDSPAHAISRVATQDIELDSRRVAAGDIVLGVLGAMNRDPAVFTEPDELHLARSPNPHVAFGEGPHFCWGAPLSRLEAAIAIPAIVRRFPRLRLGGPPRWRRTLILRGLESLPLALD